VTVNLIDTPGHVDFTAEVERSLRVLDGAVVVFSAREGVEAQSETVWRQADKYGVPRIALVNKLDREGADFHGTVKQIADRLGAKPLVLHLPQGLGPPHVKDPFRGLVDLVEMKLLTFPPKDEALAGGEALTRVTVAPIPDDLADEAALYREQLVSTLFDFSDEIAELAMQEAPIPPELMRKAIRQATIERRVVPVLAGSALDCIGVQPVLDAVAWYLPSPADVPPVEGLDPAKKVPATIVRKADPKEPFCGLVFKIIAEKHGDLYFVRVYSGTLKAGSRAWNPAQQKKENIAQLWHVQADRREQIPEAFAGDIVGVIGPRAAVTGDTLCDAAAPILLETIQFPETVISMAIEPETSLDRKKLAETLEMMKRQDPTFRALESEETGQTPGLQPQVPRAQATGFVQGDDRPAGRGRREHQSPGGRADARRHGHTAGGAGGGSGGRDGGAGLVPRGGRAGQAGRPHDAVGPRERRTGRPQGLPAVGDADRGFGEPDSRAAAQRRGGADGGGGGRRSAAGGGRNGAAGAGYAGRGERAGGAPWRRDQRSPAAAGDHHQHGTPRRSQRAHCGGSAGQHVWLFRGRAERESG